MPPVIARHEGQDNVIDAKAAAVAPWDEPGDAGLCHQENIGALSGVHPPPSGDPHVHVPIHLRFLASPLGQAMPNRQRTKLIEHLFGHIADALAVPEEETGIPMRPIERAAKLANLELAYRNGSSG